MLGKLNILWIEKRLTIGQVRYKRVNIYMYLYGYPGAKVRVITREARYYTKTRVSASFYAIISRAHAARTVTRGGVISRDYA